MPRHARRAFALALTLAFVRALTAAASSHPEPVLMDTEPRKGELAGPQGKLESPFVQLGSRYDNTGAPGPHIFETGTGTVVELVRTPYGKTAPAEHERAIMTSAHLVQGDRVWVRVRGRRVRATVLVSDAVADLAVVKVPGLNLPAAYEVRYTSGDKSFFATDDEIVPRKDLAARLSCLSDQARKRDPKLAQLCPPLASPGDRLREITFLPCPDAKEPGKPECVPTGVILSPRWAEPIAEDGDVPGTIFRPMLDQAVGRWGMGLKSLGGSYVVPAMSPDGNSGSIAISPRNGYEALGIPSAFHLYFRHVTLSPATGILGLLRNPKSFPRPEAPSRWTSKNGILHLQIGDDSSDLEFTQTRTGRASTVEPSGATTAQPGGTTAPPGGTTAPPGGTTAPPGGTTAPPGSPGAPCPTPPLESSLLSNGLLNIDRFLRARDRGVDPHRLSETLGITSRILFKGKPVYGIQYLGAMHNSWYPPTLLPPTTDTLAYLVNNGHWIPEPTFNDFAPQETPPEIVPLIRSKLNSQRYDRYNYPQYQNVAQRLYEHAHGLPAGTLKDVPHPKSVPGTDDQVTRSLLKTPIEGRAFIPGTWWAPGRLYEPPATGVRASIELQKSATETNGIATLQSVPDAEGKEGLRIHWTLIRRTRRPPPLASASSPRDPDTGATPDDYRAWERPDDPAAQWTQQKIFEGDPVARCELAPDEFEVTDDIDVTLDALGRLPGKTELEPVILVKSRKGDSCYLNLQPLIYMDPGAVYPSTILAGESTRPGGDIERIDSHAMLELKCVAPGGGPAVERHVEFDYTQHPRTDGRLDCNSYEGLEWQRRPVPQTIYPVHIGPKEEKGK